MNFIVTFVLYFKQSIWPSLLRNNSIVRYWLTLVQKERVYTKYICIVHVIAYLVFIAVKKKRPPPPRQRQKHYSTVGVQPSKVFIVRKSPSFFCFWRRVASTKRKGVSQILKRKPINSVLFRVFLFCESYEWLHETGGKTNKRIYAYITAIKTSYKRESR